MLLTGHGSTPSVIVSLCDWELLLHVEENIVLKYGTLGGDVCMRVGGGVGNKPFRH